RNCAVDSAQDTIHSEGTVGHDRRSGKLPFPADLQQARARSTGYTTCLCMKSGPRSSAMLSNRLAFAALAIACIGAAAGGGYLATRQNMVPAPMSAQSQPPAVAPQAAPAISPQTATTTPAKPVEETEGVVGEVPARSA